MLVINHTPRGSLHICLCRVKRFCSHSRFEENYPSPAKARNLKQVLQGHRYFRKAPMSINKTVKSWLKRMSQQLAAIREPVLDWFTGRPPDSHGLVWENRLGEHPVQVWLKSDRIEMRFGNRVVQSSCLRSDPHQLLLSYTRHMMLCLLLVPRPNKVLHIGLGGGTVPVFLRRQFPELHQTIIEINEAVCDAAKLYFGFEEDELTQVVLADACDAMKQMDGNFDLIFVDAFGPSGAPEGLLQNSFLEDVSGLLKPGGCAVGNCWSLDTYFPVHLARWRTVFSQVFQVRARPTTNMILFGMKDGQTQPNGKLNGGLKDRASSFQKQTGLDLLKMLRNLKKVP